MSIPKEAAGLGKNVCVVGPGGVGLVALKNMLEQGFEVTLFERNDYVGGIWHATSDPSQTSILPSTVCNVSKQGMAFTDFPFPESTELHPTGKQVKEYLESYADHFDLRKHIHLSTSVCRIERDDVADKWIVQTQPRTLPSKPPTQFTFDRLIVATGATSQPVIPNIPGLQDFQGKTSHAQAFRDASKYAGKNVLLVGLGPTGADTIEALSQAGASRIYVSHRRRFVVIPRIVDGKAMSHHLNFRKMLVASWLRWLVPSLVGNMTVKMMLGMQFGACPDLKTHKAFQTDRDLPSPSALLPVLSEDLADNLLSGRVESVQAISKITGPNSLLLTDGTELSNIDALIFCTGMRAGLYSLLLPSADPTNPANTRSALVSLPESRRDSRDIPYLYRGFLSISHPHSLAFLGHSLFLRSAFLHYDLITMGLAQIWKGAYPMPTQQEMHAEVLAHYEFIHENFSAEDIRRNGLYHKPDHDRWLHAAAGTGVYERLGSWTSLECWRLWWGDRELYTALMDGPPSGYVMRLFDTGRGRKMWTGAREVVLKDHEEMVTRQKELKEREGKVEVQRERVVEGMVQEVDGDVR